MSRRKFLQNKKQTGESDVETLLYLSLDFDEVKDLITNQTLTPSNNSYSIGEGYYNNYNKFKYLNLGLSYLQIPESAWNSSIGDMTIEFHFKERDGEESDKAVLGCWGTTGATTQSNYYDLLVGCIGAPETFTFHTFGGRWSSSSYSISAGTWYHCAIVKTSNSVKMYIDGKLVDTAPSTYSSFSFWSPLYLNYKFDTNSYGDFDIARLRIYKGVLYDSDFTAPKIYEY